MNFISFLIYVALPLIGISYLFLKKKYSYFEEKGIPHIKPSSWIFGNVSGIGRTLHMMDLVKEVYDEGKRKGDVIAGFYSSISPSLIITDLELIKRITVKDFSNFVDRGIYNNEKDDPLTGNLLTVDSEKWRFLRTKLSPVFTSGKIKLMYSTVSDKGDTLVKRLEKDLSSGSIDVKEVLDRFTMDVISSCAFGMEANTLNDDHPELTRIFRKVFKTEGLALFRLFFIFLFPKLAKVLRMRQFEKLIGDFFHGIISESMAYRETNNVNRNDFLDMLIQLKNKGYIDGEISKDTRKLSMEECVAQAFVFFLGGADTSSTAIAWAIIELGLHPEILEKLRKEIIAKTENEASGITYENLHEMTYLNQVFNETLRKHNPVPGILRQALNEYHIPGSKHVIKQGEKVMIATGAISYDEEYWENPKEFNPDRFTNEEIAKRPSFSFMPFGEGPKNCIGIRFAQVNVKFAIATIIRNFKVTVDTSKTEIPLKYDPKLAIIGPIGGFWANFERIK